MVEGNGPLSDRERHALAALDTDRMVADLVTLLRVPSVSGTRAEVEVQYVVEDLLREAGLHTDLWPIDLDELTGREDFPGAEVERTEAVGLVGVTSSAATPGLVLCGHVDVVPPGEPGDWTTDPFGGSVRDGVVFGRGACDMKAGVAVNIAVARTLSELTRTGLELAKPLAVHSVIGEEDGGLGAYATLQRGHLGEACVITEPTAGEVVVANAGALTFRIEVPGRSAHGALRLGGQSAVEAFWPIHRRLLALEAERNAGSDPLFAHTPLPYALSIGMVHAGDWTSSVPDRLVAEGRFGVILGEDPAAARRAFEEAVAAAAEELPWLAEHPAVVTWPGGQFASGRLPAGHDLLPRTQAALGDAGLPVHPPRGEVYGSDLRQYAAAGIPTLHYGPGDPAHAHAPDERVTVAELVDSARALLLLAIRTCG